MPRTRVNRISSFALLLLCLALASASATLAGCGGGSGGGGGGTQPPVKTTPTISAWPTASAITYGQTLASSTLAGGTASTMGTFAWTTPATAPSAGAPSEAVTFTPTDSADYNTVAGSVTVTVNKAAPTVSVWPTASAITYGQTLASSTLAGGTASTMGTFAWTTPATAPSAGAPSEAVTFTPTDSADYNTVAGSVTVTVNKAAPTVSVWPTASAITYGQTLASSTLAGGTASTMGTFAWTTPATAPSAGAPSEAVTFTPTDSADYNTVAGSVAVAVNKATPTVSAWPTASAITSAQTLASSTLTGGTASVLGTFAWTAPSTSPAVGTDSESVTFTPSDTTDYTTLTATVSVTVTQAPPTITAISLTSVYCEAAPCGFFAITIVGTNFQSGGTISLGMPGASFGIQSFSATQIQIVFLVLNPASMTPGMKPIQYCQSDGITCSNKPSFLLVTAGNTATVDGVNNELYNLDPATGTVWKFKINPSAKTLTADGTFNAGTGDRAIVYDPTTNYVEAAELNGIELYQQNIGTRRVGVLAANALDVAAYNGEGCASDPSGMLYCVDMTQYFAPYGQIAVNSPSALAMGPVTTGTVTETDVLVFTRDGTPTVSKLKPNGASNPTPESSLPLTGVTAISSLPANTGGWYEALGNGMSGTLASADKLAIFVNASTMQKTSSATFTTPPYLMVPDPTHGKFIVELPNLATTANITAGTSGTSGFASIDPATGKATTLNSTSTLFGGLAVSADGTTLYVCSGSLCQTQPNQ